VWRAETLTNWDFDAVLLADIDRVKQRAEILARHRVPAEKMLAIGPTL
jgi:hypothetical protein